MKIFLCWGKPLSHAIAGALNEWLPLIIQAIKPFYSPELDKGTKWSNEIDDALEGTKFGIVCLTPDNLDNPWIHYETGALSKTKDALIWTLLYNVKHEEITLPLSKFQHTLTEQDDILRLLKTINKRLKDVGEDPLPEPRLEETFKQFWPKLEAKLKEANKLLSKETIKPRGQDEILTEILDTVRSQEQRSTSFKDILKKLDQLLSLHSSSITLTSTPNILSTGSLGRIVTFTTEPPHFVSTELPPRQDLIKTPELNPENKKTEEDKDKKDKTI